MKITSNLADGVAVLALEGELDLATADQLITAVSDVLTGSSPHTLVIDLKAISFCDSAGIRALVFAHKEARDAAAAMRITNESGIVRRVLEITGVHDLLNPE